MATPRRLYIYLVSAISLQAFAWAMIDMLRSYTITPFNTSTIAIAMHIAIVIVSVPVYLIHWLWGQRLAKRDKEELVAPIRTLYIYVMLSAFLAPIISSAFGFVNTILLWIAGQPPRRHYPELNPVEAILFYLVPIIVLGILWLYHNRIIELDSKKVVIRDTNATIRRLYVLGFSALGLVMMTMGIIYLLRWIISQISGGDAIGTFGSIGYIAELSRLIVGIPIWLIFWGWAQRLFYGKEAEERHSALRKFYLYATIFAAVISIVTSITFIIEGLLSLLLGGFSSSSSGGDIIIPISIIIPMIVLWAYHARVLKEDIRIVEESERQAGLRRLYFYLIAGIGLSAFLVGISGILNVLINSLVQSNLNLGMREQLSWYLAVIISGLPVWFIPWYQIQGLARAEGTMGVGERRSLVRKIYLYFFLFIATMTILSSTIYIIFRIISAILGESLPTTTELGQAIAFTLVALGVWFYHWSVLSVDRKAMQLDQEREFGESLAVIIGFGARSFSKKLIEELSREYLGISLVAIGVENSNTDSSDENDSDAELAKILEADIIIGPWNMVISKDTGGAPTPGISSAIVNSPAIKLLVPTRVEGWEWAGVDQWNTAYFVQQSVNAIKQIIENKNVKPVRPLGAGAIIGIIIGAIFLLLLLGIPIFALFGGLF